MEHKTPAHNTNNFKQDPRRLFFFKRDLEFCRFLLLKAGVRQKNGGKKQNIGILQDPPAEGG